MFSAIGRLIEKIPWVIISLVIVITIILASFTSGLEFQTNFEDFTPDDPLIQANIRVGEYFGSDQEIILILAESTDENLILDTSVLKDLYEFQNRFMDTDYIISMGSFVNIVNSICLLEFFTSIENCTDKQIETALNDLLHFEEKNKLEILDTDDSEEFEGNATLKSVDIKNSQIIKDDENFIFKIEVYDLSNIETEHASEHPLVNISEWYINFENEINDALPFQMDYRIFAQLVTSTEVEKFEWKVGGGPLRNIINYLKMLKSPKVTIKSEIKPFIGLVFPENGYEFSLPLENANLSLDYQTNQIIIKVSRSELSKYGIAPSYGLFKLPAKLTNFTIGTRYYEISQNLYQISNRFNVLISNYITNYFSSFDIENLADQTDGEFNISSVGNFSFGFEKEWIDVDKAPDNGTSLNSLEIFPSFLDELQIGAQSFISNEYQISGSSNSTIIIVGVELSEELGQSTEKYKKILQTIENIDENISSLSFHATGGGILNVEIDEVTGDANVIIGPSIFIIIIIVLFISFRNPSYVLIAILALVISSVWLFGTMALLDIPFNVIAVAIFPIVLGLGVDYSVHLFHSYKSELINGLSPGRAIKKSIEEIGTAMFLAMVTTVIAFLSFLTASIPPIRDFGMVLALGVIYTFITAITFSAPVRYLVDKRKLRPVKKPKSRFAISNVMDYTSKLVITNKKIIFVIIMLISVMMLAGTTQIETGFDYNQFVPDNTPSKDIQDKIAEDFPFSSQNQEYILIEGDVATVKCLKGIAKTHQNFQDDTYLSLEVDGSVKSSSVYTILSEAVENNQPLVSIYNLDEKTSIPKTDDDVKRLYDYLIDSENYGSLIKTVLNKNGSIYDATVIRVYIDSSLQTKEGTINTELTQLKKELEEDVEDYGNTTAVATGGLILTLTITDSLTTSQITSTLLSIILAALVVIIVYRNPVLGLIAMIPVCISIVWILGTMYFIGYSLNILTVTVTSITIGIGIDYAIHATQRFRYTADRTGDFVASVCKTISQTGGALLIAALTTTLGFGILILAPIPPQQQFGLILSVTIVFSFITSVFFLPIILYLWGKRQKQQKGYIISPNSYDSSDEHIESCITEEEV